MTKKLKCKGCGYKWNYKGKHKFWATCPQCRNKVSLKQIKGADV